MGTDSQPGGGGGTPGTLGSTSYTPPPIGQAGAPSTPPPADAPFGGVGSGTADSIQVTGGVGDVIQEQVQGSGFRTRPENDPFAGGRFDTAVQEARRAKHLSLIHI